MVRKLNDTNLRKAHQIQFYKRKFVSGVYKLALIKMTIQNKISLLLLGLIYSVGLSAQTLKGEIFNKEDSLPVMFANIVFVDSEGNTLTGTSTNQEGQFNVQIPASAELMRIFQLPEFAELHIINLTREFSDTLDLGRLPLIKSPTYLKVQFKGVSEKKEKQNQRQLLKDYNKQILSYKDTVIEFNNQNIKLSADPIKQPDTERLRLLYILNFEEIKNKN